MASQRLAGVDLNLLVALDALLIEKNVTRAARRLGIGQPAMSGALGRLRTMLDDPLLVRTAHGMALTARAEELRGSLMGVLALIEQTVSPSTTFDAATAERTFVLCTVDYLELMLVPLLLERLRAEAPGVSLEVYSPHEKRLPDELSAGAVDLAVGYFPFTAAGTQRRLLFHERHVAVMRADHAHAGRALSVAEYAALGHVLVSPVAGKTSPIDQILAELGLERRIMLHTPHFLAAAAAAANTDLVATLSERLARLLTASLPLRIVELPLEVPRVPLTVMWHDRTHHDPGHRWSRRLLMEVASAL